MKSAYCCKQIMNLYFSGALDYAYVGNHCEFTLVAYLPHPDNNDNIQRFNKFELPLVHCPFCGANLKGEQHGV